MAGHGRGQAGKLYPSDQMQFTQQTPEMAGLQENGSKNTTITGAGLEGLEGVHRCYMGRRRQRVLISLALLGLLWASTHDALLPWAVEAHFQIQQTFTENILCAHPKK